MAFINKQDINGTKGVLLKGEFGYDEAKRQEARELIRSLEG